jgi:hypothetical protein
MGFGDGDGIGRFMKHVVVVGLVRCARLSKYAANMIRNHNMIFCVGIFPSPCKWYRQTGLGDASR